MKQSIRIVRSIAAFCFLTTLSLFSGCQAAPLTLVQDGQPRAEIIIAEQPERSVRLAAQQLQDYVVKISGAKLPILTKPSGQAIKIFVGHSSYTDALKVTAEGINAGAYRMVTGPDWMVLIGDDTDFTPVEPWAHNRKDIPRATSDWQKISGLPAQLPKRGLFKEQIELPGTIGKPEGATTKKDESLNIWYHDERGSFNAVSDLLRELGVRWYMPGELGEVVPEMKTISVPQRDQTVRPDFPVRDIHITYSRGYDAAMWAMHQGLRRPYGLNTAHGMSQLGTAEVFAEHPDWFAVYGGKPTFNPDSSKNQLNLSNEELFEATVAWVRKQFDTYDFDSVSVMPPDGFTSISQDPISLPQDTPEQGSRGHLSDYVWGFVNRVAIEVAKTHPDKKITNCAYGAYTLPPLKIAKLAPNVQVSIVGGRKPFLNTPEEREYVRKLRKDWAAKTDNPILIFENYPFAKRGFYLPAFIPHDIGESINATKGVSDGEEIWYGEERDFTATTKNMGFNHFMLFFTARMYWGGKEADVDAIFREYCRLFYGPAAQEMQEFFTYSEANWRDMDKDKAKADEVLALFAKAQAKVDPSSVYGKRVGLIDDYLNSLRNKSQQLGKARGSVPKLRLTQKSEKMQDVVIDGKLDDAAWQDFPRNSTGSLREIETGQAPTFGTTFKAGWGGNNLYFAIRCEEPPGEKPNDMSTTHDDQAIWMGDAIEIELETESHSYYQIAVSPSGVVADLDRGAGKNARFDWNSQAEVATQIGDGYWTAEIRIPVTEDDNDPLHQVIGRKPTQSLPWFINIGRQRIRENGTELSAFSPTGGSFHVPLKFAHFYAGRSHKFEAEPDDDFLNDIKLGDYDKALSREKISDRQKSYALELSAARERKAKNWDAADKIAEQIPVDAVKKTVQMENLFAQRKASEVIQLFGQEDISTWPFWQRGAGYFIRGKSYAATGNGEKAVADYNRALEFTGDSRTRERIELDLASIQTSAKEK